MKWIDINEIDQIDLKGKIICFVTDTVYGVGCMIDDFVAVEKIYSLKHRDLDKPLAILVPNKDCLIHYVDNIPAKALELMNQYWPGALTIILKKRSDFDSPALRGLETIGVRMPNSKVALQVLNQFGLMATTSVNISGNEPLNSLEEIYSTFGDKIDYYVTNVEKVSKVSSTVVLATTDELKVLRQGDINI